MKLFEFKLAATENIQPWGEEPNLRLSWYALTDGIFRMNVGDNTLFRYSNEIIDHWKLTNPDADYNVAAFARDFFQCISTALSPIPDYLQPLAWNWSLLRKVLIQSEEHESNYEAFRWLGERSPWTSYLTECPEISFIRKENDIIICWDNRHCVIDDLEVWQSSFGTFIISVENFVKECKSFADNLLNEMKSRISMISSGKLKTKIPIDSFELLKQHETWHEEFNDYFTRQDMNPDVPWDENKKAIESIIKEFNIKL